MSLRSNLKNVKIDDEDEFLCQFYACARHSTDSARCQTIIWFDEEERVRSVIPPAVRAPRTPRTPRKQVDIRSFGEYTAPSTLKRKAEPASPSVSRSVKTARIGYVDAGTQTGETETISPLAARSASFTATRLAPTTRPLPRRRLFDNYLADAERKSATIDPVAPQTREHNTNNQDFSLPTSPTCQRPWQSLSPPKTPMSSPRNQRIESVLFSAGGYPRSPSPQIRQPTTPPFMQSTRIGLITPGGDCPRSSHHHWSAEWEKPEPSTPTNSNHRSQSQSQQPRVTLVNSDSDDESYDWDDDLNQTMLEVVESVENQGVSRLFI
ncbi:predicted protein [Aspergillus nidulans FGSC A4]|uniref:Uncharacterized protein n=1 Tax=Emericella nidulans (strain FGSC A4 / ATCC 38163 / CBS 112.46 / NRRL 194 / M139) TaxID=227321 RepID=Q5AT90_EMENI|nr:hypothetical protein [Aspergillus nidulans FGSC A4]EAA67112.1 predicted protein [Aspergillus nidulans FGSC A4]CBF80660.1 TPA: conserved hypothetical protein [Aspergillus nidulans FGSC A4]|eukprot:XP_681759.1 predicted protein [Aspergillus nidulans FGSC A4]